MPVTPPGQDSLSVAVAQPPTQLHEVAANAEHHAAAIRHADARVVVFPELSVTGYAMQIEPLGTADPRLKPIVAACAASNSVAFIGAPTGDSVEKRISMLRVDGEKVVVAYNKMWLGGDEPQHFVAGSHPVVATVDGWRLGLAICKDTGVPKHAAATAALDMDVYVAGVCELDADREVQPRRAAQVIATHGVPVVIASFAGPTGGGFDQTAGRSTVWRADGSVAAALGPEPGRVAVVTLRRTSDDF